MALRRVFALKEGGSNPLPRSEGWLRGLRRLWKQVNIDSVFRGFESHPFGQFVGKI